MITLSWRRETAWSFIFAIVLLPGFPVVAIVSLIPSSSRTLVVAVVRFTVVATITLTCFAHVVSVTVVFAIVSMSMLVQFLVSFVVSFIKVLVDNLVEAFYSKFLFNRIALERWVRSDMFSRPA
jgi:hypothetical protein